MGAAQSVPADLAARYAQKVMAGANNQLTADQAREIFLAVSVLVQAARDAEHSALMAMTEILGGGAASAADFSGFTRSHLGRVKESLVFIGQVMNGKIEG